MSADATSLTSLERHPSPRPIAPLTFTYLIDKASTENLVQSYIKLGTHWQLATASSIHSKMSAVNLQEVHDFLIRVAHKAGEMITSATPSATGAGEKKNSVDLVVSLNNEVLI